MDIEKLTFHLPVSYSIGLSVRATYYLGYWDRWLDWWSDVGCIGLLVSGFCLEVSFWCILLLVLSFYCCCRLFASDFLKVASVRQAEIPGRYSKHPRVVLNLFRTQWYFVCKNYNVSMLFFKNLITKKIVYDFTLLKWSLWHENHPSKIFPLLMYWYKLNWKQVRKSSRVSRVEYLN